jgi:hypothetical protein
MGKKRHKAVRGIKLIVLFYLREDPEKKTSMMEAWM